MDSWRQEKKAETDPTWEKRVAMGPIWEKSVETSQILENPEATLKKMDSRHKGKKVDAAPKQAGLWNCLSDSFPHWGFRTLDC